MEGGITVVVFWAAGFGRCQAFASVSASAAVDYTGKIRFGRSDVDASPRTAGLLG